MQQPGMASDKTFHLKWNNHLQNLSQLFTTIYSSSALADVTLSCRDGTLKAHKLVLSACSPYFEQIFKDNPCKHPVVILKGIPFSEINQLVEFMYKGSVDVQELDLQSLMHTASELEIRGLAYEARDTAAQMLNVNLEYPTYPSPVAATSTSSYPTSHTDVERLKQIHLYQQSMMRAEELRRRRRDEPATCVTSATSAHAAVNSILAAAAREMEEARHAAGRSSTVQTEKDEANATDPKREEDAPKKRSSLMSPDDARDKKKKMTVRFQDDTKTEDSRPTKSTSPGVNFSPQNENRGDNERATLKVVNLAALQKQSINNDDDSDDKSGKSHGMDEDEETESSGSVSDTTENNTHDGSRPHVCDVCDLRFQRASHLSRHKLTHTGERPFTCGGCGRSFARSDKLRVHTKICEREDPTVDMTTEPAPRSANNTNVMSGMVRSSHRESGHLVFTPGGDVMLPPRAAQPVALNAQLEPRDSESEPPRRGRGRPRKTPLPTTPKIKKRRGRPPKTSLDMEGCVLTSGSVLGVGSQLQSPSTLTGQQLLLKKRRGRPPKNFFGGITGDEIGNGLPFGIDINMLKTYGRPNENYNATNLPFGDFAYLTEMMYNPTMYYGNSTSLDPDRSMDDQGGSETHDRTIDVSDSSSDEEETRIELEENVPPIGVETSIMTVGDCQIVKLPSNEEKMEVEIPTTHNASTVAPTTPNIPGSVTITPITTVGDCTIRTLENNT